MIMQRKRSFEQAQAQAQVHPDRLAAVDASWRAANYLGIAQLYLQDNVLLRRPLRPDDIKARLRGHWGTQPGLNMVYVHLNRLIQETDANVLLVVGPGQGAPAVLANLFLEGTLCEYYPHLDRDEAGLNELARQFAWPDGVPDRVAPLTPGMIQEGTESGSSLARAAGAAFDNPDLTVACVIGDAEAQTGPLLAGWQFNRFLNPVRDGAVLPILHLGGYTPSGPSVLGRMDNDEIDNLLTGFGYQIGIVAGDDPHKTHEAMWQAMDWAFSEIRGLQEQARAGGVPEHPAWPMLILRTPTGWTSPHEIDDQIVEGASRSYGLPVPDPRGNPGHLKILEDWLRSCRPDELFNAGGHLQPEVASICPRGERCMGRNPHANGGHLRVDLALPAVADYAVEVSSPGSVTATATRPLSDFIRDTLHSADPSRNFRLFCPDDTISRHMPAILEATGRVWMWPVVGTDEHLSLDGRILEMCDAPTCQGWLEGYLLTGRHGLLLARQAALSAAVPMLEEYARWLEAARQTPWRKPVDSLTCLLFADPADAAAPSGLLALAGQGKNVPLRIYLPADANSLLCTVDQCLRSLARINIVIACAADLPQWLDLQAAREHSARGASAWDWAGSGADDPDAVLAAAGAAETVETLAAAQLLRRELPDLRLRVVSVVDLLALSSRTDDPPGLSDAAFASLFGASTPVVFAVHSPPALVHELIRERPDPSRFFVHGYIDQDLTTTPFDVLVRNRASRYHLALAAIEHTPRLAPVAAPLIGRLRSRLALHDQHVRRRNQDLPEITDWRWD